MNLKDIIHTLAELIRINIVFAFGVYSALFFPVQLFVKKPALATFDKSAIRVVIHAGVLYALLTIPYALWHSYEWYVVAQNEFTHVARLNYYFIGYWLQPVLVLVFTQLLRMQWLGGQVWFRLLVGAVSLVSFVNLERFVIIVTSMNDEYLPATWSYFEPELGWLIIGLVLNVSLFVAIVGMYHVVTAYWHRKSRGANS